MVVETYEVEEVAKQTVEQCDEAKALVEELGLQGQAKIYSPPDDAAPSAFPYRKMTAQEAFVYRQLLPSKTKLSDYADGAIPLRVLQVAAHVNKLMAGRANCELQVWHPKNADVKDPLLVMREGYEWGSHSNFILARWGDVLEEFSVLANHAKAMYKAQCLAKLEEAKQQIEVWIRAADSKVHEHYNGGTIEEPSAYWI